MPHPIHLNEYGQVPRPVRLLGDEDDVPYDAGHAPVGRLMVDEAPLVVLPSLAKAVGLDRALFVQQLHYWSRVSGHDIDGRRWIFNTLDAWREQFPFWSRSALHRIIAECERDGLIDATAQHNASPIDRTKWYAINYDAPALDDLRKDRDPTSQDREMAQPPISDIRDIHFRYPGYGPSISQDRDLLIGTETTPETTPEKGSTPPTPPSAGRPVRAAPKPVPVTEGFEAWYAAYPKHKGRADAERAWSRLAPDEPTRAAMLAALDWQRTQPDWLKEQGRYVPLPATWLNDRRWHDEPSAVAGVEPVVERGRSRNEEARANLRAVLDIAEGRA